MTETAMRLVTNKELLGLCVQILRAQGVSGPAAQTTAAALVRTSARGIHTHGVARLPTYVERLAAKDIKPQAQPVVEARYGMLHCHGDFGLGPAVLAHAMDACLAQSKDQALVACHIEACGHLGALGSLLLPAVEQGCMAFLCQRTPAIMALPGSTSAVIGNNPLAFAAPMPGSAPLVFDTALSVVARGHVLAALRNKETRIPPEWAIDAQGQPTTDPNAALHGAMQPLAAYKGLGLAMLVECLTGALCSASAQPPATAAPLAGSASNVSAWLMVVNPAHAVGQAQFGQNMLDWMRVFVAGSSATGRYPGQRQHAAEQTSWKEGVAVAAPVLAQLQSLLSSASG